MTCRQVRKQYILRRRCRVSSRMFWPTRTTRNPILNLIRNQSHFPILNPTHFPIPNPTRFPIPNLSLTPIRNQSHFPILNPTHFPIQNPTRFPIPNLSLTPIRNRNLNRNRFPILIHFLNLIRNRNLSRCLILTLSLSRSPNLLTILLKNLRRKRQHLPRMLRLRRTIRRRKPLRILRPNQRRILNLNQIHYPSLSRCLILIHFLIRNLILRPNLRRILRPNRLPPPPNRLQQPRNQPQQPLTRLPPHRNPRHFRHRFQTLPLPLRRP